MLHLLRLGVLLPVLLSACAAFPNKLEDGHIEYNEALRSTGDDEILLNIVRLRYFDTVEFLSVGSISSQLEFNVRVGGEAGDAPDVLGGFASGSAGFTYSSRPTFTFIPERSGEFSRRLVEPIRIDVLSYLLAADWDINVLFRLFVRGMNGLHNELGVLDEGFRSAAGQLAALQANAKLFVGFIPGVEELSGPIDAQLVTGTDLVAAANSGYRFSKHEQGDAYVLTAVRPKPVLAVTTDAASAQEMLRGIGLEPGKPYYSLEAGTRLLGEPEHTDTITLRTRSLLTVLLYLAQAVEVPEAHAAKGIALSDWPPQIEGAADISDLFQVHTSESRPEAQYSVRYRGHWFYVDDTDVTSRVTFLHLAELFRLGLSRDNPAQDGPVLTLPVGR